MNRPFTLRIALVLLTGLLAQAAAYGQTPAPSPDLQTRLRERFDIVPLQRGVALVPRDTSSTIRMVQVVDGVVSIDGETLTGAQLRERLGADADRVLQLSYLTVGQQRELAGTSIAAPPPAPNIPPPPPPPPAVERTQVNRGDRVRFGGPVIVGRNERIEGDVVAMGGPVTVDGEVEGDVTALGGPVALGPDAIVRGDVNAIGGPLSRAPGAQVLGEINEVGGGSGGGFSRRWIFRDLFGTFWSRLGSLAATVLRITVLLLIALIVVAFGRPAVERIAARTAASPLRSGLIGLSAEILFVPVLVLTVVVLAVSIVGIPLLALVPFAILLLMLVALVGFVGLAYYVGTWVIGRFGRSAPAAYGPVAIGVLAIGAMTLLAKIAALAGGFVIGAPLAGIGYFIEFVAWTMGLGAAILYWYENQTRFGGRKTAPEPTAP